MKVNLDESISERIPDMSRRDEMRALKALVDIGNLDKPKGYVIVG